MDNRYASGIAFSEEPLLSENGLADACIMRHAPAIKYLNSISGRAVTLIIQSIALAAVIAVPASLWYRDDNFKAELGMIRATDNNEWDNVADIFEKVQTRHEQDPYWQPTRIMVLLKDLALIETGKEGERSYAFDNGSSKQNCDFVISSSIQNMQQVVQ